MYTTRWSRIVVMAVAAAFAGARPAGASPGAVVVTGSAPAEQQATVRSVISTETTSHGWSDTGELSKSDAAALLKCAESTTPWSCVPASLTAKGIDRVLIVNLDASTGEDGARILELVGKLIVMTPGSVVVRQRFCEQCAEDRLTSTASELALQMLRELAVRAGKTMLYIRSEPPGARISLDGESLGATNASLATFPGTHQVVLERPGFRSETREVTVEENHTSELSVTLVGSADRAPVPAARPSHLVPAVVIASGLVGLAVGVTLQVTKDGPPLGEPQPARIYSAPGIGLGVAGAALVGVGAYLWWRAGREASVSAPSVSVVEGGGLIGWSRSY